MLLLALLSTHSPSGGPETLRPALPVEGTFRKPPGGRTALPEDLPPAQRALPGPLSGLGGRCAGADDEAGLLSHGCTAWSLRGALLPARPPRRPGLRAGTGGGVTQLDSQDAAASARLGR